MWFGFGKGVVYLIHVESLLFLAVYFLHLHIISNVQHWCCSIILALKPLVLRRDSVVWFSLWIYQQSQRLLACKHGTPHVQVSKDCLCLRVNGGKSQHSWSHLNHSLRMWWIKHCLHSSEKWWEVMIWCYRSRAVSVPIGWICSFKQSYVCDQYQ